MKPIATDVNPQKLRRGMARMLFAAGYSLQGLKAGWGEAAFRQEVIAAGLLAPLAFWLGSNWMEVALLLSGVTLVLIVELLNTAIEATVDRVGTEWHVLAKRAKDLGSAAVLLALLLCAGIWLGCAYHRFFA